MSRADLRAARANRVFGTVDRKHGVRGLSKIADCVRMCFSSVRNRRSARTGRRPRKFCRYRSMYPPTSGNVGKQALRAPRANRVFGTEKKRIRTKNTVISKTKKGIGVALIQDRRRRADVPFIRMQSVIRADGAPSAQARVLQFAVSRYVD